MHGDELPDASARAAARRAAALAVLGAWTIVVPYLGRAVGFGVDVGSKVEVVDHLVPGAFVAMVATVLAARAWQGAPSGTIAPLGGGVCFLAGFWVLATHVPLLADAARGDEGWGAALWHASTAVPLVVISLWILLGPTQHAGRTS